MLGNLHLLLQQKHQLTAVHIPNQGQLTYSNFTWLMPQTLLLPGGNRITLSYTDFLQVKERILKDPANNEIAKALYEYDLESNIRQIISEQGTYRFDYDNLYRLTHADYPENIAANDETFDYDAVGNRTKHSVGDAEGNNNNSIVNLSYNEHNQLIERTTQSGTTTFTYNANGHTATKTENGSTTEYLYNHEERLIAVRRDGQTLAEYAYNPQGQRIRKIAGGQTTYYFYNQHGLAAEYDASGNLIKEYHFHPQKTWMTDPLFQRTANNTIYYYQNDHLGTPQRLLSNTGAVVWQANYSAFGEAEIVINTVENNLRFPGQYFDEETGLHQNYFRDYDPRIGRYIQRDPIGLLGGINSYAYGGSDPLSYIDPLGLARICRRALEGYPMAGPLHHAHIWYDDGSDSGFFDDDTIRPDKGHDRNEYTCDGPDYDDDKMREAEKEVKKKWDMDWRMPLNVFDWNNCQDYTDAVVKELKDKYKNTRRGRRRK